MQSCPTCVTECNSCALVQEAQRDALKHALEAALLTADEFRGGSSAWAQYANPFLTLAGAEMASETALHCDES